MTTVAVKSAAIRTAKVTGATISFAWSLLVVAVAVNTVFVKAENIKKAITA